MLQHRHCCQSKACACQPLTCYQVFNYTSNWSSKTSLCIAVAAESKAEAGRRLQPYTDHLVYTAVIALPWLAPELQHLESDPEGLTVLASQVEQYLTIRPASASQDALNPFALAAMAEDSLSLGGSGSTSFLPQLWAQVLELKDNAWKLISVASYANSFEAQLAACKPLDLPQLTVPLQPPGIASDLPLPQVILVYYLAIASVMLQSLLLACHAMLVQWL